MYCFDCSCCRLMKAMEPGTTCERIFHLTSAIPDISYDIWDLGEFDQKGGQRTNWGTKEELLSAIKVAADRGIISYIDAVMNHKYVFSTRYFLPPNDRVSCLTKRAGADDKETFKATMVDENDRTKTVGEMHDIDGWTKFTFPGRGDKYSNMKWVRPNEIIEGWCDGANRRTSTISQVSTTMQRQKLLPSSR